MRKACTGPPAVARLPKRESRSTSLERFDPAQARALKRGHWLVFAGYPGLRMTVSGKTRTFSYRYRSPRDESRVRQIRIGNWPAVPWEKAVVRWTELRDKRDDGVDPQLERRKARELARVQALAERREHTQAAITVRDVCDRYLTEHINVECRKQKSRDDVRRMFNGKVYPALGDKSANAITRGDASDFLATVKLDAPAVARLLRSRLGGAWEHAIDRKLLPAQHVNPWRDALRGKLRAGSRERFLDDRELSVFLDRVRALEDGESRDGLLLTLMTGARSGEVVGLDWDAVDLDRGLWTLHDTKTGVPRTLRLPRQAAAVLKSRGRGFNIPQGALAAALREAKHFGLRHFTPHDLRRSARTGLARLGVRDEVAEAALGHVEGGVRGTYNLHRFEAEVGEALQAWCDHLHALQAPEISSLRQRA